MPRDPIARLLPRGPWLVWLAAACAVRVAIPLSALAAGGRALPGLPRYDFDPAPGDAQGFYSAARDFMAAWGRLSPLALLLVAVGLITAAVAVRSLWRRGRADLAIVFAGAAVSLAVVVAITQTSRHTGAAVFGWPLIWSAPMLPYRALGLPLDPRIAFGFGLVLALARDRDNHCRDLARSPSAPSAGRSVAAVAVGVFAFWPLLEPPAGRAGRVAERDVAHRRRSPTVRRAGVDRAGCGGGRARCSRRASSRRLLPWLASS